MKPREPLGSSDNALVSRARARPDDPELLRKVREGCRMGLKLALVADYAGIGQSTLFKWLKLGREGDEKYTAFVDAIDGSSGQAAAAMLLRIQQAATAGQWQAAAWLLERRFGYVRETDADRQRAELLKLQREQLASAGGGGTLVVVPSADMLGAGDVDAELLLRVSPSIGRREAEGIAAGDDEP